MRAASEQRAKGLALFLNPEAWLKDGICIWCGRGATDENCRIIHGPACRIAEARELLTNTASIQI